MSKFRNTSDGIRLSYTLTDGESNLFIRCKIFNDDFVDVTNAIVGSAYISLSNIFDGLYGVKLVETFPTEGQYLIYFEVYDDAGFTQISEKYGIVEEDYRVSNFVQTILDEVPDNILLDNDARLDNLNDIQNIPTNTEAETNKNEIINTLTENIDSGEGRGI